MQKKIVLTNDFHHTEVNLSARGGELSPGQIKKAKRVLCGMSDCTCSNDIGIRGCNGDNDLIVLDFDDAHKIIAYVIS